MLVSPVPLQATIEAAKESVADASATTTNDARNRLEALMPALYLTGRPPL
jgi:hypothetical protein